MPALTYCMSLLVGGGGFKIDLEILPSWDYVGTFSVLGRLFFALACFLTPCWAFVAHAGRFLAVLGRSGSDFGLSKTNFEIPKPHFSRFCRARRLAIRTHCAFAKTTIWKQWLKLFRIKGVHMQSHERIFTRFIRRGKHGHPGSSFRKKCRPSHSRERTWSQKYRYLRRSSVDFSHRLSNSRCMYVV